MDTQRILSLEKIFSAEKRFIKDGYYRIRQLDENQKELSFLVADACGSTTVHPQITIKKENNKWSPIKLIDMGVSPTQMMYRDEENAVILDELFEKLVSKFEKVAK